MGIAELTQSEINLIILAIEKAKDLGYNNRIQAIAAGPIIYNAYIKSCIRDIEQCDSILEKLGSKK